MTFSSTERTLQPNVSRTSCSRYLPIPDRYLCPKLSTRPDCTPSGTETPAFIKDMSRTGNYEAEVARLISSYPLKRLGQPIDMAYAVAFFASEESSFITGTHLMVDGGYTAQ